MDDSDNKLFLAERTSGYWRESLGRSAYFGFNALVAVANRGVCMRACVYLFVEHQEDALTPEI